MTNTSPRTLTRRILAGELWPPLDIGDPKRRHAQLQSAQAALSNLTHYLLLYDQLVVPTQDFLVLGVLLRLLGERHLLSLLDEGALRFVRVKGSLAYAGSGGKVHGLCSIHLGTKPEGGNPHPYSGSLEDVAAWALAFLPSAPRDQKLLGLTLQASDEVPIEMIQEGINDETERDILQSERLGRHLSPEALRRGVLPSLRGEDIRLSSTTQTYDEVDFVLAVAHGNATLFLAKELGCEDSGSAVPIQELLSAKVERVRLKGVRKDWDLFRKFANIPDIGEGVVAGSLPVDRLLTLRRSEQAKEFRVWFHEHCRDDIETTAKGYIDLLTTLPRVNSLPHRVLRFVLASAIGLVNPALGVAAGAADSFLLQSIFARGTKDPKVFTDRVRKFGSPLE